MQAILYELLLLTKTDVVYVRSYLVSAWDTVHSRDTIFPFANKSFRRQRGKSASVRSLCQAIQNTLSYILGLPWVFIIKTLVWCCFWWVFIHIEFGAVWVVFSLIALIFMNLGERKKGEYSAYSVFNKGFRSILGTMTAEQLDREIRLNANLKDSKDDIAKPTTAFYGSEDDRDDGRHKPLVKRRAKKANRTYEERLKRRQVKEEQEL